MTDQAIACTVRCLEQADVARAMENAKDKPFAMVSFICRLSGQQEQVVLLSEASATALAQSLAPLGDPESLCERDIATLVERDESDVVADLEQLRAVGLLSERQLEGMKYYSLADAAMRYLLRDKIAALAG